MRLLDITHIPYQAYSYDYADGLIDGISVAKKTGKNEDMVFKTLLAAGNNKQYYVFIIPVAKELDLKKAAKAAEVKSIEMAPVKEIFNISGYIRPVLKPC